MSSSSRNILILGLVTTIIICMLIIGLGTGFIVLPKGAHTTELEQRISELEGQNSFLRGQIDERENHITTLQSQISELQSQRSENFELHGFEYEQPNLAPNVSLVDQNGDNFTLHDQKGKVILLFFGYSHCPDICPMALIKFGWVHKNLGPEKAEVMFLLITVDPERDTPEVLQNYVDRYRSGITALTGSKESLESVWDSYGIFVNITSDQGHHHEYSIDHTALLFLLDRNLMIREVFTIYDQNEEILADVRNLLGEI